MLQNPLDYDVAALLDECVRQRGADVGTFVHEKKVQRRQAEDLRYAELVRERDANHARMSALRTETARIQQAMQAELDQTLARYQALLAQAAAAASKAQGELLPLLARNQEIQREMLAIVEPRSAEREVRAVNSFASQNADRQRAIEDKHPAAAAPLTALERINLGRPQPPA